MNPNCSVCWGSCQGVIGENEVLISTGTRNFKGRAGHPSSKVYLASAATVTASAIKGEICTADMLLIYLSREGSHLFQVVSHNKLVSVGGGSPTEINAPRGCAVIL